MEALSIGSLLNIEASDSQLPLIHYLNLTRDVIPSLSAPAKHRILMSIRPNLVFSNPVGIRLKITKLS